MINNKHKIITLIYFNMCSLHLHSYMHHRYHIHHPFLYVQTSQNIEAKFINVLRILEKIVSLFSFFFCKIGYKTGKRKKRKLNCNTHRHNQCHCSAIRTTTSTITGKTNKSNRSVDSVPFLKRFIFFFWDACMYANILCF